MRFNFFRFKKRKPEINLVVHEAWDRAEFDEDRSEERGKEKDISILRDDKGEKGRGGDISQFRDGEIEKGIAAYQDFEGEGETSEEVHRQNLALGDKLESVARKIITVLVSLLPLFVLPFFSDFVEIPKTLLLTLGVGAAAILWISAVVVQEKLTIKYSKFFYLPLAFLVATVLSVIFSADQYKSIFGQTGIMSGSLIVIANGFMLMFLVANLFSKEDVSRLIRALNLSFVLALLVMMLEVFLFVLAKVNIFAKLGLGGLATTVGMPNALGIIAAMSVILGFSSKSLFRSNFWRWVSMFGMILGLGYLFILDWWVLYFITIIGLIARFASPGVLKVRKVSDFTFTIAVMLLIVFGWLVPISSSLRSVLPLEASLSQKASLTMLKETVFHSPITATFGFGPENFSKAFDLFRPLGLNKSVLWNLRFQDAISEILTLGINLGILGVVTFLAMLVGLVYLLLKRIKGKETLIFTGLVFTILATIFLFPLPLTHWAILWLLLGAILARSELKVKEFPFSVEASSSVMASASIVSAAIILLIAVQFFFLFGFIRADAVYAKALKTRDVSGSVKLLTDAYNINPKEDIYARAIGQQFINLFNQELNKPSQKPEERNQKLQNILASSINFSERITKNHPQNSLNWFTRGLVYQNALGFVGGADDWAVGLFNEAVKLSPRDPLIFTRLGMVYLTRADQNRRLLTASNRSPSIGSGQAELQAKITDDLKNAEESLKKAVELKPDLALAIYNLGVVYERQGQLAQSIRQLEQSFLLDRSNPGLLFELGLLYYRNNQKDNAFATLQRAVSLFDNYSNARWFLALIYEERGDLASAIAQLKKVAELNPGNQVVVQKLEALGRGQREIPPKKVTEKQPLEEGNGRQK